MVIAATKGGSPTNPDWYHNLKADPKILVEVHADGPGRGDRGDR